MSARLSNELVTPRQPTRVDLPLRVTACILSRFVEVDQDHLLYRHERTELFFQPVGGMGPVRREEEDATLSIQVRKRIGIGPKTWTGKKNPDI